MQVSFSSWFQDLFSNFQKIFDVFWSLISIISEAYFFIIIFALIYWCFNKKSALFIASTYFTSSIICLSLKDICRIERPIKDENIRFLSLDNIFINTKDLAYTYSFPSKSASVASSILTGIGLHFKNKKVWIGAVILSILVSMSRIYLGTSWLIDVIIGVLIGLIVVYLLYKLLLILKEKDIFVYLVLTLLALIALIFLKDEIEYKIFGALLGGVVGLIIERKFISFDPTIGAPWKKIVRLILGLILVILLKEGLKYIFSLSFGEVYIFHIIRYFIVAIFVVAIYPLIAKMIKL